MVWWRIHYVIFFGFFLKIFLLSIQGSTLQIYLETMNETTWYNAFNSCLARGMELAILNSNADYNEAKELITSRNVTLECVWIGYKMKNLTLHAYGWVNGEDSLFEHWGLTNPDYFYQESCVRLRSKYQYAFADQSCTFNCFFMCTGGSKPVIHDVNSTLVIKLGQPLEVMCKYTSLWNSTVEWIKVTSTNEQVIQFDEESILYNMSSSTVSYVTENILSVVITLNDIDLVAFKCRVENQFGIDDGPLNVIEKKIGPPIIQQTVTTFVVTISENVTFVCNATSSCPNITGIVWRREVNGTTTTLTTDPFSQYLTLTQVGLNDSGIYSCSVTNTEGTSVLYFTLQVTGEKSMCPCECDYMMPLDLFSMENHTFEEWKEILAPITQQLRKELQVNKSSLSSTINRHRCMKDERTSAERLGYIGIISLVMVPLAIIFADFTSCCSKTVTVKKSL